MKQGLRLFEEFHLSFVQYETGVGATSMILFVFGPVRNSGWGDFDVSFCVWSGAKQGLKLFVIGPARNRLELSMRTVFVIGPLRNRLRGLQDMMFCRCSLANQRNINLKARGCWNHQEILK